jgi:hypothetical protein
MQFYFIYLQVVFLKDDESVNGVGFLFKSESKPEISIKFALYVLLSE